MSSSKAELERLRFLQAWEKAGAISDLRHQAPIKIIDGFNTKYTLERNSENHTRKPPKENKRQDRVYTPDYCYKIPSLKLLVFEEFKSDYTRKFLREAYALRKTLFEMIIANYNSGVEFEACKRFAKCCKLDEYLSDDEIKQGYKIVFFENEFIYYKYQELVDEFKRKLRLSEQEASLFATC